MKSPQSAGSNRLKNLPQPNSQTEPKPLPSVAIDFDGCLARYDGKFDKELLGEPNPGAIEALKNYLAADFHVIIFTTRAESPEAAATIMNWLLDNDLVREEGQPGRLTITAYKLPAVLYIDDRAFKFEGKWPTPKDIREFKPYWQKD